MKQQLISITLTFILTALMVIGCIMYVDKVHKDMIYIPAAGQVQPRDYWSERVEKMCIELDGRAYEECLDLVSHPYN